MSHSPPSTHRNAATSLGFALAAVLAASGCEDEVSDRFGEPRLVVEPTQIDFGMVPIDTETTQQVQLRNDGDAVLTLEAPAFEVGDSASFTFDLERMTLAPGASAELTVRFAPTEAQDEQATLRLRSDSADGLAAGVALRGAGVRVDELFVVEPPSVSFGNVIVGTTERETVAVTNPNAFDIELSFEADQNVGRCDDEAPGDAAYCVRPQDFELQDDTFALPAGARREFEVQFEPKISDARERGRFVLRGCDNPSCRVEVRLEGLGAEFGLSCSPRSLDFGFTTPGGCATQTLSCENTANGTVSVLDWQVVAPSPVLPPFTTTPPRAVELEEGEALDIDVDYCPTSLGTSEATLRLETAEAGVARAVEVALVGSGGGADAEVLPEVLNFGLVTTAAPARRTVLVSNTGFEDLVITDIDADTAGTGAFSAPGAGPTVVPPGGSHTITIEFMPLRPGVVQSSLLIRTTDPDEPEIEVQLLGEGIELTPCRFEVAPTSLDFGEVLVQGTQQGSVEVRNLGTNDCLITSARLEPGSDPEFSMAGGALRSVIIGPGSSERIPVEYRPSGVGSHTGAVEFSISSATSPFNRIPLTGQAVDASLLVTPRQLDFGTNGIGCTSRSQTVRIFNPSTTPAQIDRVLLAAGSNPSFTTNLASPLPAPLSVPPGGSVEFEVSLAIPASAVAARYAGAVEIYGTFLGQPVQYVVALQGASATEPEQRDRFVQLGRSKVDVLFVVDFTGSMGQEQAALAANFQSFLQFAQAQALDYQVGVTTTDTNDEAGRLLHGSAVRGDPFGGPFANRIVSASTAPNPASVFGINAQARNLSGGSAADEAGLYAAYQALSPPVSTGHNAGFLRPDASLSVVFVSDEPEQSHLQIGAPSTDVDFYVSFFQSLKGPNRFSASAIVGDSPGGCNGAGGAAAPAPRYVEVARRTGGAFESICGSDWSRALTSISSSAAGFRTTFGLSNPPVVPTLAVQVNGLLLPQAQPSGTVNWTYDLANNALNFTPFAVPAPGAEIIVRYIPECL